MFGYLLPDQQPAEESCGRDDKHDPNRVNDRLPEYPRQVLKGEFPVDHQTEKQSVQGCDNRRFRGGKHSPQDSTYDDDRCAKRQSGFLGAGHKFTEGGPLFLRVPSKARDDEHGDHEGDAHQRARDEAGEEELAHRDPGQATIDDEGDAGRNHGANG